MNKAEYLEKRNELNNKMQSIRDELKELSKQYIADNTNIEIGSKVRVFDSSYGIDEVGYLMGYKEYCGNIQMDIHRMKKNGEPHPHNKIWYSINAIIMKVEV